MKALFAVSSRHLYSQNCQTEKWLEMTLPFPEQVAKDVIVIYETSNNNNEVL